LNIITGTNTVYLIIMFYISRACHAVECWQYQIYSFNISSLKQVLKNRLT